MNLTVGKLVWFISILLFIIMSYNENIFSRILDIFNKNSSDITYVQEFISSDTTSDTTIVAEIESTSEPTFTESIPDNTLYIEKINFELEKIKWKQQQYEDKLSDLEIKIESKKNSFFDNILALITTVSPLLVPIVTARYHKKRNKHKEKVMKTNKIILILLFIVSTLIGDIKSPNPGNPMPLSIAMDEDPYPRIKNISYKIEYTKSKQFVNMKWDVTILGKNKSYKMAMDIVLYDKNKKRIIKFTEIVNIKQNELQVISGEKMILTEYISRLNTVGANLALLQKTY